MKAIDFTKSKPYIRACFTDLHERYLWVMDWLMQRVSLHRNAWPTKIPQMV